MSEILCYYTTTIISTETKLKRNLLYTILHTIKNQEPVLSCSDGHGTIVYTHNYIYISPYSNITTNGCHYIILQLVLCYKVIQNFHARVKGRLRLDTPTSTLSTWRPEEGGGGDSSLVVGCRERGDREEEGGREGGGDSSLVVGCRERGEEEGERDSSLVVGCRSALFMQWMDQG